MLAPLIALVGVATFIAGFWLVIDAFSNSSAYTPGEGAFRTGGGTALMILGPCASVFILAPI
jgi:hypothetical protein